MENKTQRNPSVELYRVIMMFGICLIHVCGQGKYLSVWPKNLLCVSVVGFIFISGYYGVKFSLSKLASLYALAIFYCLLIPLVGGGQYLSSVLNTWRAEDGYWFLHAYAVLMMISPLLEKNFISFKDDDGELAMKSMVFCGVVFVWGWLSGFACLKKIVPSSIGITSMGGFLTMLGVYVAARTVKYYHVLSYISLKCAIVISLLVGLFISFTKYYFSSYSSLLQFLLAMFIFVIFQRLKLPQLLGRIILFVSPSMFSVYLIHAVFYFPGCDSGVYSYINFLRDTLIESGHNNYFVYLYVAAIVFMLSLALDFLRRGIIVFFAERIKRINQFVDQIPYVVSHRLVHHLCSMRQRSP